MAFTPITAQQDLAIATAWLTLGTQVFAGGSALWGKVKAALVANGYAGDTSVLDGLIADSERRKALAEADANAVANAAPPPTTPPGA